MTDVVDRRAELAPLRGPADARRTYCVSGIDVRAKTGGGATGTMVDFYGHASVTDKGYEMFGGPDRGGFVEYVDRGAFKKTLKENADVAFLVNHGGMTLARTKAGTLSLAEDAIGLEVRAQLDTRVSAVNDLVILMQAGNIDEMSFAFRVVKQKWLDREGREVEWWDMDGVERHITEVSLQNGDVSAVNFGASPWTDADLRSLDDVVRAAVAQGAVDLEVARRSVGYLESVIHPDKPKAAGVSELRKLWEKRLV